MIDFIKGQIVELIPTHCVLEVQHGIGYDINISLNTYTEIGIKIDVKLYIHEVIREDAYQLYGFVTKIERELFRKLITVSGVGPSVARALLSSLSYNDLGTAIIEGNSSLLKGVKGIGVKTAERIILDLKDKIKIDGQIDVQSLNVKNKNNPANEEAVMALVMLGYNQKESEKAVKKISENNVTSLRVDQIIKQALKII